MVKKLESIKVKAANGNGEVWVYDGDVDYQVAHSRNPSYYYNDDGVRRKTRPRVQHDGLLQRVKSKSGIYSDATIDDEFLDFDNWVSWAEKQDGFMCEDEHGMLFHLDKDLLGNGDKHYSPENCCFLPNCINGAVKMLNSQFIENVRCVDSVEGEYSVSYDGKDKIFKNLEDAVFFSKKSFLDKCEHWLSIYKPYIERSSYLMLKSKMSDYMRKRYSVDLDKSKSGYDSKRLHCFKNKVSNLASDKNRGVLPKGIAKVGSKYRVQILFDGKRVSTGLGMFEKLKDAEIGANNVYIRICEDLIAEYGGDYRISSGGDFKRLINLKCKLVSKRDLLMGMYF